MDRTPHIACIGREFWKGQNGDCYGFYIIILFPYIFSELSLHRTFTLKILSSYACVFLHVSTSVTVLCIRLISVTTWRNGYTSTTTYIAIPRQHEHQSSVQHGKLYDLPATTHHKHTHTQRSQKHAIEARWKTRNENCETTLS